jgi:hypothetical protein
MSTLRTRLNLGLAVLLAAATLPVSAEGRAVAAAYRGSGAALFAEAFADQVKAVLFSRLALNGAATWAAREARP